MRILYLISTYIFINIPCIFPQDLPIVETYLDRTMISGIVGNESEIWIATYGKGIYCYQRNEING